MNINKILGPWKDTLEKNSDYETISARGTLYDDRVVEIYIAARKYYLADHLGDRFYYNTYTYTTLYQAKAAIDKRLISMGYKLFDSDRFNKLKILK